MKKIIILVLIIFTFTFIGCKDTKKTTLNQIVLEDLVYSMNVQKEGHKYLINVDYFINYTKHNIEVTLNKTETKQIISDLGIFSSYMVNMSEDCMDSLGLKKEEKPIGDRLKDLGIYEEYDLLVDLEELGNALSFKIINNPEEGDDSIKRAYIVDYLFNNYVKEKHVDNAKNVLNTQNENDYNTLVIIENSSSKIESEDLVYVSLCARVAFGSGKRIKNKTLDEYYYLVDHEKWLFCFDNDVIDYDRLNVFEKELLYKISEITNYRYLLIDGVYQKDMGRAINKPFEENTRYEDFIEAIRYLNVINKGYVYSFK